MKVVSKELNFNTKGEVEIVNITNDVQKIVSNSGIKNGIVALFVPGSTAALTTIEYEPGLLKDFPNMLERVAPREIYYEHEKMWHDGNGHSHVRASLIGPSITIPILNGKLTLGTWQQIVFVELDVRQRSRRLIVHLIGE
jgi:secondary thiamine-phosphate synthase enzyme